MQIKVLSFIFAQVITTGTSYEKLSREELLIEHVQLKLDYQKLQHELAQLRRMIFGSRHERFLPEHPKEQLALGLNVPATEQPEVVSTQKIEYTREKKTTATKSHPVRTKLPGDLPREQVVIEPDEDVTGFTIIGKEITEELEYTPGKFFVRQFVRPKYARPLEQEGKPGVVIAELPPRIIDKGIMGPGLLAQIVINKYQDHLPLNRQQDIILREGNMKMPASTLGDGMTKVVTQLEPLYEAHKKLVLSSDYVQCDETPIKVLDKNTKGKAHQGYYWVYRAPVANLIFFDYRPGRGGEGPKGILKGFRGCIQSDGYGVYDYFSKQEGIMHIACWAHARREFYNALDNNKAGCEYVLGRLQELYAIERRARDEGFTHEQRLQLRKTESIPILNELGAWLKNEYGKLPGSSFGKAIAYTLRRWEKLCAYTTDGRLEIDNNLVENAIRPVALGRKNYLFAGSHQAAQRAAMIYSLLGTCKVNGINPLHWLRDVLERLPTHPINRIEQLLPHLWESQV